MQRQLKNYLTDIFPAQDTRYHALQPFNPIYYHGNERASFAQQWYRAQKVEKPSPFITKPLRSDEAVLCTHLAQLTSFLRHPGQYFLTQRLGAYLDAQRIKLDAVETFKLDNLERFWLEDEALNALVRTGNLDDFRRAKLSSGQVLPGRAGRQQLDRVIDRADQVYQAITPYLTEMPSTRITEIDLGGQKIQIQLTNLHDGQLVKFRGGSLRARDELSLWVDHLAANMFEPTPSIFIARGKTNKDADICRFRPIAEDKARQFLQQLLNYYNEGVNKPLFLPSKASRMFVKAFLQDQDAEEALAKTQAEWVNDQRGSEGEDRYWQRLFQFPETFYDRFSDDALTVWQPLLEARHD